MHLPCIIKMCLFIFKLRQYSVKLPTKLIPLNLLCHCLITISLGTTKGRCSLQLFGILYVLDVNYQDLTF